MARTARAVEGSRIDRVLSRGNGWMRSFRKAEDRMAFERGLTEGWERYPVALIAM